MTARLDWAAPIIPGQTMMGLELGTHREEVLAQLEAYRSSPADAALVRFANSPALRIDVESEDFIILHAADIEAVDYPWQNELARLIFDKDRLSMIIVCPGPDLPYQGKVFGKVGLGDRVADLEDICPLVYDDAEEWFYARGAFAGLWVSGHACTLLRAPDQTIGTIRVVSLPSVVWSYGQIAEWACRTLDRHMDDGLCPLSRAVAMAYEDFQMGFAMPLADEPVAVVAIAAEVLNRSPIDVLPFGADFEAALRAAIAPPAVFAKSRDWSREDRQLYENAAQSICDAVHWDEAQGLADFPAWTYTDYNAATRVDAGWGLDHGDAPIDERMRRAYEALWPRLRARPEEEPLALLAVAAYLVECGGFRDFSSSPAWEPGFRRAIAPKVVELISASLPDDQREYYLAQVETVRWAANLWA